MSLKYEPSSLGFRDGKRLGCMAKFDRKRVSSQKQSGNQVYFTNALLLLIKIMLCSKRHCQKGFTSILFPHKIGYIKSHSRREKVVFYILF